MQSDKVSWEEIERILEEMVQFQKAKLFQCGQRIVPTLTQEDMLQPNDFPELENHPFFRYEEGILAGEQMIQMALRAYKQDLTRLN